MAIESIASVKGHFETGDRPTQAEFENLIDTLGRPTLIAIASGAEGGATGLVEIEGTAAVTTRSLGAFGQQIVSVDATTSARDALGISSVASIFLDAASTASGQSLLGISSHQATFLLSEGTASSQSLLGVGTAGLGVFEAETTASAVSALGVTNHVVQQVYTQDGEVATGTTQMVYDDSIPQITEGDEYMTLAITPSNSNNLLQIDVFISVEHSANVRMVVALFQDSTADALAAMTHEVAGAADDINVAFRHRMTAGTTSSTTFRVRAGGNGAGTTTFNGTGGGRRMGGVMASTITITELTA